MWKKHANINQDIVLWYGNVYIPIKEIDIIRLQIWQIMAMVKHNLADSLDDMNCLDSFEKWMKAMEVDIEKIEVATDIVVNIW